GGYNLGAGLLARLGNAGVISGSLAGSAGRGHGGLIGAGYQYVRPEFSLDLHSTRTLGRYADLGSLEQAEVPRRTDRATLSFPLPGSQSVTFSYIGYRLPAAARIGSASYSVNLHSRLVASISAYNDFSQPDARGVFLSLSLMLGERRQASASTGRQNGQNTYGAGVQNNVAYAGGVGWSVRRGRAGNQRYTQGQVQYLGRYGQVTGFAQEWGRHTQAAAAASGAVVWMDGALTPSRRIDDGFALVSTGLPAVEVLHENRRLGRTNGNGHLLVPDLM
ncbi:fimbria/pilus outer membrane usher protein, partial [Ralstonia pseudosolanacearum]